MKIFDEVLKSLSLVSARRHQEQVDEALRDAELAENERRKADRRLSDKHVHATETAHAEALIAATKAARAKGFAEGRGFERQAHLATIRAEKEEAETKALELAVERERWLVSEDPVGLDDRICERIRADVIARVQYPPEDDQWKMILANDPATYVIAGAGSGKSTSLVLRVLALNLYKGIDRNQISVFTFTKASREDFIGKLRARMRDWGTELTEPEAKGVVRTFHSMVLKMAREGMHPQPRVLELLERERRGTVLDIDVENLLEVTDRDEAVEGIEADEQPDDAVGNATIDDGDSHRLNDLLRAGYERAMKNREFYGLVLNLYKLSLVQARRATDGKTKSNISWISKLDGRMSAEVDQKWRTEIAPGLWPLPGIEAAVEPMTVSSLVAEKFWTNGFAPKMGVHIILGGAQFFEGPNVEGAPTPMAINSKRKLLAGISEKPIVWIDTVKQLTDLRTALHWLSEIDEKRCDVPMFSVVPPGAFKSVPVFKAFHELAQFVENLGLPVTETLASAVATKENGLRHDAAFMRATALFWPYFEQVLAERGIKTFNQLFAHFSEENPNNFDAVPSPVLGAMRHLLIDEFQDVSPQIVKWIRGCQTALAKRGMAGSITCVGDDWQSIYGWRGSSPEFFVKFKEHFPAVSHGKILLEDNFRSSDHILRCAESVIKGVAGMEMKTCRAKGRWADSSTPVAIHETQKKLPYPEIRRHITAEIERTKATEDRPMLVLSRSRQAYQPLSGSRSPSWGKAVRFMTFHAAKGLEAQSVVLLEDCFYSGTNPLKNFLYQKAGLGNYDEAQRAESKRLAYVGITRAMETCTWYGFKQENGAISSIPKGAAFAVTVMPADKNRSA